MQVRLDLLFRIAVQHDADLHHDPAGNILKGQLLRSSDPQPGRSLHGSQTLQSGGQSRTATPLQHHFTALRCRRQGNDLILTVTGNFLRIGNYRIGGQGVGNRIDTDKVTLEEIGAGKTKKIDAFTSVKEMNLDKMKDAEFRVSPTSQVK